MAENASRFSPPSVVQSNVSFGPQPNSACTRTVSIYRRGILTNRIGFGEGARLCHDALAQCGRQVFGIDLTTHFRQPGPIVPFLFRDGRAIEGVGTLILHINGPFVPMALSHLGKRVVVGKRILAYWAWELPSVPPEWRFGVPFVHEIWVPSRFSASAMKPIAKGVPVHVVPHPVTVRTPGASRTKDRRTQRFTALVSFNMASGFTRKNPLAAIDAFEQAFDGDPRCRLLVRVLNAGLYPDGKNILETKVASLANVEIDDGNAGDRSVEECYALADVVISLHRSEGFGLVIAEAMLRGLPVVATNWSGNVDFLNSTNGLPVAYTLVPALDPQSTYDDPSSLWAEADINDAALKLRMLRENPSRAINIGAQAANDAWEAFGAEKYLNIVDRLLS